MAESKISESPSPVENVRLSEEHERLGRAVTEMISEYARRLDALPVTSDATPGELEKIFDEPLPVGGKGAEEIFARFRTEIAPHAMQIPSPRYYGLFNPTP